MTTAVEKKFSFRKTKDETTGKEIPAPEPIVTKVELLTLEDVVRLLQSGNQKVVDMVVDSLNAPILGYYRELIDDLGIDKVRAEGIPAEKYTFETIAELPPASKSMFDEETWNAFKEDYKTVIMEASQVDEKRATVGAEILAGRLNRVKGNLDALEQFKDRIMTWYSNSSKQEEMLKVYQYLLRRCEDFIVANQPEAVLATF
jgi:hypothetical protein